jgi:hypothetical protein
MSGAQRLINLSNFVPASCTIASVPVLQIGDKTTIPSSENVKVNASNGEIGGSE